MKEMEEYINRTTWRLKENSNTNYSLSGLQSYVAQTNIARKTLNECVAGKLHKDGKVYIHDLGFGLQTPYCCGWDLQLLFRKGLKTFCETTSGPAKHFSTACDHIMNFTYIASGEWAGAQAFSHFDTLLAPFVYYDKLDYNEVKQSIQRTIFNLGYPLKTGYQTPFVNWSFDLTVPKTLKDQPVIVGGEFKKETYGSFQDEVDMINLAFLDVMKEGDYNHRPFAFPIPTYTLTKEFDWDSEVSNSLFELTAKMGLPYFSNQIGNGNMENVYSMCLLGTERITWKYRGKVWTSSIQNICKKHLGETIEVLFNGKFIKAKPIKVPYNENFLRIYLKNGVVVTTTKNHLNVTDSGLKRSDELEVGDSLAFSTKPYNVNSLGTYDLGYFIGLYLAEGSTLDQGIQFSLSNKEEKIIQNIQRIANQFGWSCSLAKNTGESTSVFINRKAARIFVKDYVKGTKARNKRLTNWQNLSMDCRRGIFEGWLDGDGNNRKSGYTTSKLLARDLMELANSIGVKCNVYKTIMKNTYVGDSVLYTVHVCNTEKGYIYKKHGKYCFVPVLKIEECKGSHGVAFCFETENKEHLFELANGLITHNCCRLLINMDELPPRGIWDIGVSTGSIGVVTLNMPQLGYLSKTEKQFFNKLDYLLNKIKLQLLEKRKTCEKSFKVGLMPFSRQYLPDFESHFNSVGIIGMEECCQNFLGSGIVENQVFVEKVLTFIVEKLKMFKEETGLLWNFEATPAEGASFALARSDKERYEDIITSGKDEVYYTNSTHLPVDCDLNLIDQIEIQEKFQTLYSGGTIMHIYHNQHMSSSSAKELVKKIATNTALPYFDITPTFSVCEDHGHLPGLQNTCPTCGKSCSVFSRVTGYFREVSRWNPGKQEEFKNRKSLI